MHIFTSDVVNDFFPEEFLDENKVAQVVRLEETGRKSDRKLGQVDESNISKRGR